MPYRCGEYPIIEKAEISNEAYSFTILCPEIIEAVKPGQFVHIKINGYTLRRPISVCDFDKEKGTLRIVFEVRGNGTAKLAELNVGDEIDMIAPLGNGFPLTEKSEGKRDVFVGGGIGVPPLLGAVKGCKNNTLAILGFRSADKVILADDFKKYSEVIITTEDGSTGFQGFVTEPLKSEIANGNVGAVYACGPVPMLKAVAEMCKESGIKCFVSLEQRMGCGVGACAVCTCITERNGERQYLRVCKDGPVFDGREVAFS